MIGFAVIRLCFALAFTFEVYRWRRRFLVRHTNINVKFLKAKLYRSNVLGVSNWAIEIKQKRFLIAFVSLTSCLVFYNTLEISELF